MSDLLGDDHDLAALRQMLTNDPERFGDKDDREVLLGLIDQERVRLQGEAMLLGRRFFQESSKDFACKLKGYWKTWRDHDKRPDESRLAKALAAQDGAYVFHDS